MTSQAATFTPTSGARALFDQIYAVKFSKHVPLTVVLLSAVYAVFRSQHYLTTAFHLPEVVAIPTAVFIEALVLAGGASVFIACRERYLAELKQEDTALAQVGVYLTLTMLAVAFVALLGLAWADAWLVTSAVLASSIMVLAQAAQAGLIGAFIVSALLDERAKLRTQLDAAKRQEVADADAKRKADEAEAERKRQEAAGKCRWCSKTVAANNKRRHEATCSMRPSVV